MGCKYLGWRVTPLQRKVLPSLCDISDPNVDHLRSELSETFGFPVVWLFSSGRRDLMDLMDRRVPTRFVIFVIMLDFAMSELIPRALRC